MSTATEYKATLNLKTFNRDHGVRKIRVHPESNISYLKTIEGEDCLFIYKKKVLIESMTFKFYSMNDGDIICVIPYQNELMPRYFPKDPKHCLGLEIERLKVIDQKYTKIEGFPNGSKKISFLKEQLDDMANIESRKFNEIDITFVPKGPKLSKTPLPKFW
ncbi:hypothetical protein TVAG_250820 [Trichomonas vaginalis G3]|uniref:Uncharacterized protein n=1 Tax=Trichomonas vaginalis (strain ATCC PRA-98 / G3) TaxID=412133 RepID=A2FJI4_TRIV3|nr:ubiquitin-like family [Trichomonas vaginalis G3]EAX94916.1 hypothetical protein TVAG_250820 [Trichomonas vaginalis G3]KAI5529790.1 ubiquitin-like family [Trichomonas vaginalis G3]|eukprot:XP_001307846.1 hypothetical protein [Trichomonas vaginalis G3]